MTDPARRSRFPGLLALIGGGAIIPTSQNILFGRYPQKEHGMAGALFALGAITGPLLGPTIGGKLTIFPKVGYDSLF